MVRRTTPRCCAASTTSCAVTPVESFGINIYGAAFSIWLLCRAAPFIFTPFDWFEVRGACMRFHVFCLILPRTLTPSWVLRHPCHLLRNRSWLRHQNREGRRYFDLQFNIQGAEYNVSELLYDIGADAPCGRGTWVFEVEDKVTREVRVLRDCWAEDHMEHGILAGIKEVISADDFLKYFVGICGHCKTDISGGFQKVCNVLTQRTFEVLNGFKPQPLVLVCPRPKPIYTELAGNSNPNQSHHSNRSPPTTRPAPGIPPCPRFRYQVIYCEKGVSLYEVASLAEVFKSLDQIVDGMCQDKAN